MLAYGCVMCCFCFLLVACPEIKIFVSMGCIVGCVLEFWLFFDCFLTLNGECVVCTNGCVGHVLLVLCPRVFYAVMCTVMLSAGVVWNGAC
jgi:hypothetical protein